MDRLINHRCDIIWKMKRRMPGKEEEIRRRRKKSPHPYCCSSLIVTDYPDQWPSWRIIPLLILSLRGHLTSSAETTSRFRLLLSSLYWSFTKKCTLCRLWLPCTWVSLSFPHSRSRILTRDHRRQSFECPRWAQWPAQCPAVNRTKLINSLVVTYGLR